MTNVGRIRGARFIRRFAFAVCVLGLCFVFNDVLADPVPADSSGAAAETPAQHRVAQSSDPSEIPGPSGWGQRVSDLIEQIEAGSVNRTRADTLYKKLESDLWTYQAEVYEALRTRAGNALARRVKLTEMYDARVRLLEYVTPRLHNRLLGAGTLGLREVRREFANAKLDALFQTLTIPRGLRHIAADFAEAPVDSLWNLLQILFAVMVFRAWRRWAKTGLSKARKQILAIQPRTDIQHHLARLLWYFNRFRSPLEWLALVFFVSAIFEPGDLEEVASLVWVILLWTLLTRFGLLLVDALASNGVGGPTSRSPGLRLRSLRLVAAWILLMGLGLDLTSRYVGKAAIHSWAMHTFLFLLIPISLLLLHWWRAEIIHRLREDAGFSVTAKRLGGREKGFASYVNAAAGTIYILGAELLQLSIRLVQNSETGRKVVATLLRREVEREGQQEHGAEKRISEDLVLALLTSDDTVIDGPFREGIERIKMLAQTERGATVAVLAERGGGLSTFLRLAGEDIGTSMRIIDCPPGGPEKFHEALASEFDLPVTADLASELRPRLDAAGVRIVAIYNYHRIARPKMGGLAGVKQVSEIAEAAGEDILWIYSISRAAWPYISRMLGDRAIFQEIIEIPAWSEAQLEQLFDARSKKAEIEPDYRRLDFPRQFDDGERVTLEQRNRFGFRRVLWELSDGNPEVAIRLFTDSLRELPSGKVIVRLPQAASTLKISDANRTTMLVLKTLMQTEMATVDDLQASVREPREVISNSIAHCIQEGWVEKIYDHYQITWAAYRTVKRILVRRGLISR